MPSTRAKKGGTAAPVVVEEEEEEDESPPRGKTDRSSFLDRIATGPHMNVIAAFKAAQPPLGAFQSPLFMKRIAAAAVQKIPPPPVSAMVEDARSLRSSRRPFPPDTERHYAVQYCLLRFVP